VQRCIARGPLLRSIGEVPEASAKRSWNDKPVPATPLKGEPKGEPKTSLKVTMEKNGSGVAEGEAVRHRTPLGAAPAGRDDTTHGGRERPAAFQRPACRPARPGQSFSPLNGHLDARSLFFLPML